MLFCGTSQCQARAYAHRLVARGNSFSTPPRDAGYRSHVSAVPDSNPSFSIGRIGTPRVRCVVRQRLRPGTNIAPYPTILWALRPSMVFRIPPTPRPLFSAISAGTTRRPRLVDSTTGTISPVGSSPDRLEVAKTLDLMGHTDLRPPSGEMICDKPRHLPTRTYRAPPVPDRPIPFRLIVASARGAAAEAPPNSGPTTDRTCMKMHEFDSSLIGKSLQ